MQVRSKLSLVVVVACLALTVYEIPNARLIWRCVGAGMSEGRQFGKKTGSKPIITEQIAQSDPEAAAILRYCLTDANTEQLADRAAKYPDNQFFLAQLAYKLTDVNLVDPRAVLALTDRLITLDPNNAHYRYMKGCALLTLPGNAEGEIEALDQFKRGNNLPEFALPYSNYKQRVERLCEKAHLNVLDRRRVIPNETACYRDLDQFISGSRGCYPKLNRASLREACAELSKAADRIIDHAQTCGSLEAGSFLLTCTEGVRLRALDMPAEQARRVRFRLSWAFELGDVLQRCTDEMFAGVIALMKIGLAVFVTVLLFLPAPFPLVWVFVVIVNRLCGRAKQATVGVGAYILFILGLGGFVGSAVLMALLIKTIVPGPLAGGLIFVATAVGVWLLLWLSSRIRPINRASFRKSRRRAAVFCAVLWPLGLALDIVGCSFVLDTAAVGKWLIFAGALFGWTVLCAAVWGLMTYKRHAFRAIPFDRISRNRFVQLVLVLFMMAGITWLLRPVPVVPWISVFVTILLVGLTATHDSERRIICLDAVRSFFHRSGQIVVTRTKMARIMGTILLVCWAMVLVGIDLSARKWSRLNTLFTDPLSLYRPLPRATQAAYEHVLSKKITTDPRVPVRPAFREDAGLPEQLYLASPEDLSAVIKQRRAAGKPIGDKLLLNVLTRGGHDIRPIVLKALKDPNAFRVLMTRASWKDRSVKKPLERAFEKKMALLARALAPIRKDPNGAESLIIRLRWGDKTAKKPLEQALETKMAELSRRLHGARNRNGSELRSELSTLLEMDSALGGITPEQFDSYKEIMMMEQNVDVPPPPGGSDPNRLRRLRENRDRSSRVRQLVMDANMPELLHKGSRKEPDGSDLVPSLFNAAGALAFTSGSDEAADRFFRLLALAGKRRNSASPAKPPRSQLEFESAGIWAAKMWWQPCIFYRALAGVPKAGVAALLKDYLVHRQLADPFEEAEFANLLQRAGDRELAEWVFRKVAESPPTVEEPYFPDGIPIGRPIRPSEVRQEKRRKDVSWTYLDTAFPHLGVDSIPLLLEHLDSDNGQLRAFIVWRVTSLGYKWHREQLRRLMKDKYWKVRLNLLFALDAEALTKATNDENPMVRVVAQMLREFGQTADRT